jgi:pentatricopeptide repeat protein
MTLNALAAPNGWPSSANYAFATKLFSDLNGVWGSAWTSDDFSTVFAILQFHGTFEESLSLMLRIHQEIQPTHKWPDGACWARILDGLTIHTPPHSDLKAVEAWDRMKSLGTEPTLSTVNSLFRILAPFKGSFRFMLKIYSDELLPSKYGPDAVSQYHILEAHMNQMPSADILGSGNRMFEQLMQQQSTLSTDPAFWNHVVRWMFFRGDSLHSIKNKFYEQRAAFDRNFPISNQVSNNFHSQPSNETATFTLNQLMKLAVRLNKVDAVNEIYNDFFPAMGLSPSSSTDEIRLQSLLQIHDVRAAKSLYDDLSIEGHRVSPDVVVWLIQELSQGDDPHPVEAQGVFFDLLDARETPDEVLSRSFTMLTTSLLNLGDYPRLRQTLQDRNIDRIPKWRNILSTLVLDRLSDASAIWLEHLLPVYHIAQRWVSDTIALSHRHNLMHKLISHGRTDLGLELFHDMRHSDTSQPTAETYLILLSGCAKTRDARTLEQVHSALRLDSSVEPDTSVFNALMLAYNHCHLPEKTLAIWEVLSQSARLPDVETASLALAACATLPRYGLIRAREIWTFMEDNSIPPTSSSYAALLSVFASVGKWDGMIGLLERMDRDKVNAMVLGTAYNEMRRDRKVEVEYWARANKQDLWHNLEVFTAEQKLGHWKR